MMPLTVKTPFTEKLAASPRRVPVGRSTVLNPNERAVWSRFAVVWRNPNVPVISARRKFMLSVTMPSPVPVTVMVIVEDADSPPALVTVSGIIGSEDGFQNASDRKPEFEVRIIEKEQRLEVFIGKADLKAAFAASGAGNITTPAGGAQTPVTFTFTIGAQTYTITDFELVHFTILHSC